MDDSTYRLPRTVTPSRYDLVIDTDPEKGTFSGTVAVKVTVHEDITEIALNANELEVAPGWLENGDRRVEVEKVRLDEGEQRAYLELADSVVPGEWNLNLEFSGKLNPRLAGFYRSTFKDDAGAERVIGVTHLEATDARRAFPCWDEPDLKAIFGVTLIVPEGLTALSNGPEIHRESLGNGRVKIRFADTMKMSTYLVAYVVGPLELTQPEDARGVPVRVAHIPGKSALTRFALEWGVHSLNFFADYYGIPYPDAKLDNVALPDFAQGAMENLGCVTYRETLLLIDPDQATQQEQIDVAETIAHEIAHMWFGDLVTMRWWNGIWLNEAFATFMSMLAVDDLRPDWKVWSAFNRFRSSALEIDSLETTRAIEYPVHSPDDASGMFDTLTYIKGGAVLRMLEQYLGADRFRDGIRRYLRAHAYGNTDTHDLWDALEEQTGEPARRIMDAWIFQGGYPAISMRRDGKQVRFSQKQYLPSNPDAAGTWPVPLLVKQVHDGNERVDKVLVEVEGAAIPLVGPDAVVVANAGGTSFVRVWYDDELRTRLAPRIRELLTPDERYGLLDDAWSAVVVGETEAASFLDLIRGFDQENDLWVWQVMLTGLGWMDRFVEGSAREGLRDFIRDLVRPAFERLGWEPGPDEDHLTRSLRGQLVVALGTLGNDPEVRAQARELEGNHDIDPQLAAAAIEVVADVGNSEDYERFVRRMKDAPNPQEEQRYQEALARFRDDSIMDRVLASTLGDDIRTQDAPFLLARATMNRDQGSRAWSFIKQHWNDINSRFAGSNIISVVSGTRFLTEPAVVADVQAFFTEHDIPQNHLMLLQTLERQRVAAAMRERLAPELEARFSRQA